MAVRITPAGMGLTVGIIVLALVVLGGLFLVKERGEQARRDDAIEIAKENLEKQSENGALTPSVDGDTDTSGTVTEEPAASEEIITGNEQSTSQETTTETTTDEMTTTGAPGELPQTGAGDFAALIAISMLTFAGVSYAASRRAVARAL